MRAQRYAPLGFLALALTLLLAAGPASAATFVIVNNDSAGEGFNDPTPAAPVGGNNGITVGQQRLNAFQFAADLWGGLLDSDVDIFIQATFDPLTCTATSAVLGSAGAIQIFSGFPNEDFVDTWYAVSLANKLAASDLAPGPTNSSADDIVARFNSNLNGDPGCLGGQGWYYGFDANHGTNTDLVSVLLHEFGHGLGFANFVSEASGSNAGPPFQTDVYSQFTRDNTLSQTWSQINPTSGNEAAIQASAIRCGQIAWAGSNVTTAVAGGALQLGAPFLRVNSPAGIAGFYQIGAAAFGPPLTAAGVTGNIVLAVDPADGAGPSVNDACSPLTNAAAISGNIALVDRGTCGFIVKVANAQAAGATAVVVADNVAGCPPAALGGVDPSITIPSGRISLADGNTIKGQLPAPGVNATLLVDLTQRAGADPSNRALLAALNPVAPGSSISHYDSSHFPNSLMEPSINADLNPPVNDVDLTFELFQDIGWFKLDGSLTQVDSADPVIAGTNFSYTLSSNNGGSGTERPVTVTDTLPAGVTFVSATGTGWSCGHAVGVVTCSRTATAGPDLPTGALPAITVTVTAPAAVGPLVNVAQINVPSPLIDPVLANNTDNETTGVISPAVVTGTKSASGSFIVGGNITYTVVLSNAGPGIQLDNAGNEFTDVLPAGLTLVSASATSGVAATAANTVTWNGSIPASGSVTITIQATINAGQAGNPIVNQGNFGFDADGDGANEATGTTNATTFVVGGGPVVEIPALDVLGLVLLMIGLAAAAAFVLRKRHSA